MQFTGRMVDDQGHWDLLKCEWCGHDTYQQKGMPVPERVCPKCNRTSHDGAPS